jgi:hypothetical protein
LICHAVRRRCEDAFMDYLRDKLEMPSSRERLIEFTVNIPSSYGKLTYADRARVMFHDIA